jgi:hypothetical protein
LDQLLNLDVSQNKENKETIKAPDTSKGSEKEDLEEWLDDIINS